MSTICVSLLLLSLLSTAVNGWRPWPKLNGSSDAIFSASKKFEGSSDLVDMSYHMGPILSANITVHIIWYGAKWVERDKRTIRSFIAAISADKVPSPSVSSWWQTVQLYSDQTNSNVSRHVTLGSEKSDRFYSHGKVLSRIDVQRVIKDAITARTKPLPVNPNAMYLVLTDETVVVDRFCNGVCGFHYFTFPAIVGSTVPFAWIGNSAKFCPGVCAYPFVVPDYMKNMKPVKSPNGNAAIDGMVTIIAHEMAEMSTNTYGNAWYAGPDPIFPTEIADLCEGIYGTGGGGSYTGQLTVGKDGATYNLNGVGRRYLIQWLWHPFKLYCFGPNALDQ